MPAIVNKFKFNQIRTSNRVGLHPQLVAYDPATSDGAHVGFNPDTTVGPGAVHHLYVVRRG
jgi:manganese oxidase